MIGSRSYEDSMALLGEQDELQLEISIVSNSRLFSEGLALLLGAESKVRLLGCYADEALSMSDLPNPPGHIVLIDSAQDHEIMLAWTRYWRGATPPAQVLVIELRDDLGLIRQCIEAGALGFTLQGATIEELIGAIHQVRRGLVACPVEITTRLFARLVDNDSGGAQRPTDCLLTPRELQVLRLVAQDYSNQRIAELLVVEVRTVKHHVHNILEKLKLRHRWDAARLALDNGWIQDH